jgi:hypothetical protein
VLPGLHDALGTGNDVAKSSGEAGALATAVDELRDSPIRASLRGEALLELLREPLSELCHAARCFVHL